MLYPPLVENLNVTLSLHGGHGCSTFFHVVQNSLQDTQHAPQRDLEQFGWVTVV